MSTFGLLKDSKNKLHAELQLIDGLMEEEDARIEVMVIKRREVISDLERTLKAGEVF